MSRMDFSTKTFGRLLEREPMALAKVSGSPEYPGISGWVSFYQTAYGTLVAAEIEGLPHHEGTCQNHFFGFHIHAGGRCAGNAEDPFADTGMHYNPNQCLHPQHAGDLPPLLEEDGKAWMAVLSGQFDVRDVLGRSVVIHTDPDDFHTQPAGNSGKKMACGIILPVRRPPV